jgi:peroxiredoxin
MLTQSFYYYFDQRLAFDGLAKSPTVRIVIVVRDKQDEGKSTLNLLGGMTVIYDEKGELFSAAGVRQPVGKDADTTLVLLDRDRVVRFIDDAYRSQGEHLKPFENKLKELNGIAVNLKSQAPTKPLKVGQTAPDFRVNATEMLSDLRGTPVLLSFYPAAFSGTLPRPIWLDIDLALFDMSPSKMEMMSCFFQINSLDNRIKIKKEPRRIVITNSTGPLIDKWKALLATRNVEYANDPDHSVATSYFAHNPAGYSNRVSVIIDQKGKIAYIDTDYTLDDQRTLEWKLAELSK